jgi:hypothetical protein
MAELPPDLERLGAALTDATTRAVATRRRSVYIARRLAACLAASMLVFAATPSHLGPARAPTGGTLDFAGLGDAYGSVLGGPCDPPHGAGGRQAQAPSGCLDESPPAQVR